MSTKHNECLCGCVECCGGDMCVCVCLARDADKKKLSGMVRKVALDMWIVLAGRNCDSKINQIRSRSRNPKEDGQDI